MPKKPWRAIRRKLHEPPDVRVGKSGLSPGVIEETRKLLRKKGVIKVKFMKSVAETKKEAWELAEALARSAGGKVGKVVGKVAVLYWEGGSGDEEEAQVGGV